MVVRFLPTATEGPAEPASERGDLAEVIEFRSRLPRAEVAHTTVAARPTETSHQSALKAKASATDDAVRLLARRARSSGELRRELLALDHAPDEVETVLLECESSLYLDDLGLARVLTEGLRQRKRASRSQIRMKLRERLLPDQAIEAALGELDEDEEHELLREAATARARKMSGLDRQTAERRLLGFLARRGWSGERAARVARDALDSTAARGTVRFQ